MAAQDTPAAETALAARKADNSQVGSPDATQLYLQEIGYTPLLSAAEEQHYGRLAQAGDRLGANA